MTTTPIWTFRTARGDWLAESVVKPHPTEPKLWGALKVVSMGRTKSSAVKKLKARLNKLRYEHENPSKVLPLNKWLPAQVRRVGKQIKVKVLGSLK